MSSSKEKKLNITSKILLVILLFLSVIFIGLIEKNRYKQKRLQCQIYAKAASLQFQNDILSYSFVNDIIESIIVETNGNISKFNGIFKELQQKLNALECIQLAPNGIIKKSFPENLLFPNNTNLFDNPKTKVSSSLAKTTKHHYLTGPFYTRNDKSVIIIQNPIYILQNDGSHFFWGFSLIHLDIKKLFQQQTLDFLEKNNYDYILWKPEEINSERIRILAKNTNNSLKAKKPCEEVFGIKYSMWTLYVYPKDGWFNYKLLIFEILVSFSISILVAFLTQIFSSIKERGSILENLSFLDSLTPLYNARKFLATLKYFSENSIPYALIYMDLNNFKWINDNLGHISGDEVLLIVARKISNCIKEKDMAFRIGGDEFAVILEGNFEPAFIESVITRIKDAIKRETVLKNGRIQVTCSAGYARSPSDSNEYEEILKIADKKMYTDKRKSKMNIK